jgi:hypothetical protein
MQAGRVILSTDLALVAEEQRVPGFFGRFPGGSHP